MSIKLDQNRYIWLSIIFHLLFLTPYLSISLKQPSKDIPYLYTDKSVPTYLENMTQFTPPQPLTQSVSKPKPAKTSHTGILKPTDTSVLGLSMPSPTLPQTFSQAPKAQDAIHLVGTKLEEDPLRNLLGRAITAHLRYPKLAQELWLRGVVTIGMTLLPSGEAINIKMLKSSKQNMLDVAALEAIQAISPVTDVNLYLKEPKYLVIHIIFR